VTSSGSAPNPGRPASSSDGDQVTGATVTAVLTPIAGLPDGVIGFEAAGKIETSDYTGVLMPAINQLIEQGRDIRIVLVFEQFDGISAGGAWQDLKLGVEHLTKWKRIALVTDLDWMITVASLFGWMTPGELRRFPLADRDRAIAWTAES
jgi:hypothetical protein